MTGAVVCLVVFYCFMVLAGKRVKRIGRESVVVLIIITALQVAAVLYFVFTAKPPDLQ
jgi:heme/copper-type cytochrome/quinol oxidase subunit 4